MVPLYYLSSFLRIVHLKWKAECPCLLGEGLSYLKVSDTLSGVYRGTQQIISHQLTQCGLFSGSLNSPFSHLQ